MSEVSTFSLFVVYTALVGMIGAPFIYTIVYWQFETSFVDWTLALASAIGPMQVVSAVLGIPLIAINFVVAFLPTFIVWIAIRKAFVSSAKLRTQAAIVGLATTALALTILFFWADFVARWTSENSEGFGNFVVICGSFSLLAAPFTAHRVINLQSEKNNFAS